MSNWYVDQIVVNERINDVVRAVERQDLIKEALDGRKREQRMQDRIVGVGSQILVVIGNRLVNWGQHLQRQEGCLR